MQKLAALLVLALLFSCNKSERSFDSPKSLYVDHITSFTGGVVSSATDVRLKFAKSFSDSLRALPIEDVFDFSPGIKGTTSWLDNRTLVFQPSERLKNDQKYEVTAKLKRVIPDIESDKETFKFSFQTLVQNFEVKVAGMKVYEAKDLTRVKVEGQLQTADVVDFANVQKMVSATQNGTEKTLTWVNAEKDNLYLFTVEEVRRGESAVIVKIEANGDLIAVDREESIEVDIPSLSDFKILSATSVNGEDSYISILFSDPIDPRQNLTGLITLSNTRSYPRVVVNLNELKIYQNDAITESIDLTVNAGIKNTAGFPLKEAFTKTLEFTQALPEVKFTAGGNKPILPNSKGIVLPFEVIGLNAVDVTITRVFEDNMLQYLQVNSLGGGYELSRVGRPVAKKTVPLNTSGVTNLNSWNTFTLNLEDIITTEPGALYQISIGFKKQYSLYFCTGEADESVTEEENWGVQEEDSYWDDYEYYYNSDYDWEQRDNPCSNSYYGSRRSIKQMIFASDLGIIAKKRDEGKLHVFVSNLVSTNTISGATIEVYDYQQQLLSSASTDGDGKVVMDIEGTPFALIARKDKQVGYLKLDDGSSLSLSNFDISGTTITKGLKGFIYGERGVWRPADTVHLAFILEDMEKTLPAQYPVSMELYNPSGQLALKKTSSNSVGGMYRFDFITETDAPTGDWQAKAKVGGAHFYKTVKIETIKPNRLKMDLKLDKEVFSANDYAVSGDLNVRWLSGATASGLNVEYDLLLKPVKTTFKNYPNYAFDDASKSFNSSRETVFTGRLNSDGFAKVNINLGSANDAPGALTATLYGKAYEEGGEFSISSTSVPYYPYSSFVGIKAPEGDKRGFLLTDTNHEIQIVTVSPEGNPVSQNNIRVSLYKLDWRWWWDNSSDYLGNYVGNDYYDPISTDFISTSGGEGTWKLRVDYPEWGRYCIQVYNPNSGHSSSKIIYMDWPGWAGKGKRGSLDGAAMLDFGVEKEEYKVGEKIAVSMPSTEGNKVLVSLETGSQVLQTFWVETKADQTVVSFDAIPEMAPNVYVHLTMIQPHGQTSNDLPIRLYGIQSVKVVDPETVLEPVIKMPTELRPEEKYTLEISEKTGKAMNYTIAIVDEGLLDITNFKTPDPWSSFFSREALGIKTWDVYDDVMGAFTGAMDHLLAVGGDDELKPKEEKEANRFKPVVKFLGPFSLKAGATAKHTVKLPQYIGSVKTMVVAAHEGAYGKADVATPVNQPLMILATLPRSTGPGETMKLPVNVFVLNDQMKDVAVTVEASGTLELSGNASQNVQFTKSGDKVIYFNVKSKQATGVGKVKVIAKSGATTSTYDIELNVVPRNPLTTSIEEMVVQNGTSWSASYQPVGLLGENAGSVEISTIPPLNIEQRIKYLIQYPHGCIEQTTSSVFAQLYLGKLTTLMESEEKSIQKNVDAGIKRLKSFQLASGGFSYWPGDDYASTWGTNYAGHFLVEAKLKGYAVPENMINEWIGFQTQRAESWESTNSDDDDDLIQAYRLYTLAKAESPALGAMNRMKESGKGRLEAKWRLALAYAVAGYPDQAKAIVEGLSKTITPSDYRYNFGSVTRDRAMIMETLLQIDDKSGAFEILLDLAKEMGDKNTWMSTQTTAYCFISIAKFAEIYGPDGKMKVTVDMTGKSRDAGSDDFVSKLMVENPDEATSIKVTNSGSAPVFVRVIRSGIPLEGTEEQITRNISMTITYTDMAGTPLNPASLTQGTNFKAELTITNPGQKGYYNELALTQIFPSGWEIINTRLDGSTSANAGAKYLDIRDDRTMHYFDLSPNKNITFTVLLNAAYAGSYYLPSVSVGAMYDNAIFANKPGKWVEVVKK